MRTLGYLVLALFALYFLARVLRFRTRVFLRLLREGLQAEKEGNLDAAGKMLEEAAAYADSRDGRVWRLYRGLVDAPLARVLFRRGDLERAAVVTFDRLQRARAAT